MSASCLLYYITDRNAFPGDEPSRRRKLLGKIAEAAAAGVDYIQLREKDLTTRDLESLVREALAIFRDRANSNTEDRGLRTARTLLLVNSRTDVALAARADGVHLPSDDVTPADVREIWSCGHGRVVREISPPDPLISAACHSAEEVAAAARNAATLALFAPIFEKKDAFGTYAQGLSSLHQACQANIQVLALGGITLENAKSCLEAGAAGIAAIRLFQENDIADVVRYLRGTSS
jgi:thiamine-phosphate pyrophosphorylase